MPGSSLSWTIPRSEQRRMMRYDECTKEGHTGAFCFKSHISFQSFHGFLLCLMCQRWVLCRRWEGKSRLRCQRSSCPSGRGSCSEKENAIKLFIYSFRLHTRYYSRVTWLRFLTISYSRIKPKKELKRVQDNTLENYKRRFIKRMDSFMDMRVRAQTGY